MKILLSNDDGVQAIGLAVLARAMQEIAEIKVVAPDRNRSGASNSLTLDRPLKVRALENGFLGIDGTPTDCVHLATTGLLSERPDMVVSGINEGANLGDDVLYSGTVAAAIEGRSLGFPAIAISLVGRKEGAEFYNYETAAAIAVQLVKNLQVDPLPAQTILNVNIPDLPLSELKGLQVTRLGTRHNAEVMLKSLDPRGGTIYWIGPPGPEQDAGLGTDFYAVSNGYVSITPLQLDLTHYKVFDQLSSWVSTLTQSLA